MGSRDLFLTKTKTHNWKFITTVVKLGMNQLSLNWGVSGGNGQKVTDGRKKITSDPNWILKKRTELDQNNGFYIFLKINFNFSCLPFRSHSVHFFKIQLGSELIFFRPFGSIFGNFPPITYITVAIFFFEKWIFWYYFWYALMQKNWNFQA